MGFGGILAAMAQGLGTGMVKVADESWKKEADERKFKFYADESEKGRVHDLALNDRRFEQEKEMEGIRHKNRISEIAFSTRKSTKNGDSPEKMFSNEFAEILRAFNQNGQEITLIDEQLQDNSLSHERMATLKQRKDVLIQQMKRVANDDRIRNEIMSGKYGEGVISNYNILIDPLRDKIASKQTAIQELPVVERPRMIDSEDEDALRKAQDDIYSKKVQSLSQKQIEQYGNDPYLNFMKHHYNR